MPNTKDLTQYYFVGTSFDPFYNLALEQFLLETLQPDERIFFLWQNMHTVVIGKNQCSFDECNLENLEKDGGLLARRLSGGGAVYHDMGNLNFTFLVHKKAYDTKTQTELIIQALHHFGIEAMATGRNDIVVKSQDLPYPKCSGNAYYMKNDRCLHHGTLLVDSDFAKMAKYLTVDNKKLQSKGVQSVKSRVTNLTAHCKELRMEGLKAALLEAFGPASEFDKNRLDEEKILQYREKFADPDFRYGKSTVQNTFTHELKERFDWGGVTVRMNVETVGEGKVIREIQIFTDALETDFDRLPMELKGCPLEKSQLESRLLGLGDTRMVQDLVEVLMVGLS